MSLKTCLIKNMELLKDYDLDSLDELVSSMESSGMPRAEAEVAAINEKMREISGDLTRIHKAIVAGYNSLDPDGLSAIKEPFESKIKAHDEKVSQAELRIAELEASKQAAIEKAQQEEEQNDLLAKKALQDQVSQVAIQSAVDTTADEAVRAIEGDHVPEFSPRAQPRSQYIARNPKKALKPSDDLMASLSRNNGESNLPPNLLDLHEKLTGNKKGKKGEENGQPPDETPGQTMLRLLGETDVGQKLSRFRMNAIDRWSRVEQYYALDEFKQVRPQESSLAALRQLDRAHGFVASAMYQGVMTYDNGEFIVKDWNYHDENSGTDSRVAGLTGMFGHLYSYADPTTVKAGDRERLAQMAMIFDRGMLLTEQGKLTPLPTGDELIQKKAELEQEINKKEHINPKTGRSLITEFVELYRDFNEHTVKFLLDTGVITQEQAPQWADSFYVPFYRMSEKDRDPNSMASKFFGGLVGASHFAPLTGSKEGVTMPLMESIVRNMGTAITMGMQNVSQQRVVRDMADLDLAHELPKNAKKSNYNSVTFRHNGVERTFAVEDPLIYEALQPLEGGTTLNFMLKYLRPASTFLRESITRDPAFMIVNAMRDTISAYVTSGSNFTPVVSSLKNFNKDLSDFNKRAIAGGYDLSLHNIQDIEKFFLRQFRKQYGTTAKGSSKTKSTVVDLWDKLGLLTTKSDVLVRRAVYDDVLARTGNDLEATLEAYEVINFARRGRHPVARLATSVIPFLNPKIQGIDLLYRAATGKYSAVNEYTAKQIQKRFVMRSMMMMGMTGLYYMLVSDDDQYKLQTDEIRDNNYIIPTSSGMPIKLPIPFEVGLLYKTIPERIMHTVYGDSTAGEFADTLKRGVSTTFGVSPLNIQAIAPIYETMRNKDSFTQRPIVPTYMQEMEPFAQYNYNTTEPAKWLGNLANMSPMKIDHVLRGYLGTLGVYGLEITDMLLRTNAIHGDNTRARPTKDLSQYPLFRRLMASERGRGLQQDFYDMAAEVRSAVTTTNDIQKRGNMEEYMAFTTAKRYLLDINSNINEVETAMAEYRRQRRMIEESNMDPDEKKRYMVDIDNNINFYLKGVVPALKSYVAKKGKPQ
jgi:hypothetical protein